MPRGGTARPPSCPLAPSPRSRRCIWTRSPDGRRHHPGQYLPSDAAPRLRAHRAPGRPAQFTGWKHASSDRLRRFSGRVPGAAFASSTAGRHLQPAYRRLAMTCRRTIDRNPRATRRRHLHAARPMRRASRRAAAKSRRHGAVVALGRALQACFWPSAQTRPCLASCRAPTFPPSHLRSDRGAAGGFELRRLRDRRTGRRRTTGHVL